MRAFPAPPPPPRAHARSLGPDPRAEHCGSYVPLPDQEPIVCTEGCGASCTFDESGLDGHVVETRSAPKPKPSWARSAEDDVADVDDGRAAGKSTRARVEETCPECGHPELEFYTMQMRSVDEGQTVFYECLKCRHKFSQNN